MLDNNRLYFGDNFDYVIVPNLDVISSSNEVIQGRNVESKVEHLDFYYKIIELFNKFILLMIRNGIDFDHVSFCSSSGIVCNKEFYDKFSTSNDEEKSILMKDLFRSVYKDVVPVNFSIDFENTGYEGKNLNEMNLNDDLIKQIKSLSVSGLIFYNRFLAEMRDNGLNVVGINGEINNYSDFLMDIVNTNGKGTWFSVENDYNYSNVDNKSIVNM